MIMGKIVNKPFYRYSGHIEFIRFKEYYGMPRGHEHDPIYSHQYLRALFGSIFLYVFLEKDYNGKKKIVVPGLGVIMIAFFSRIIQWSSLFSRKARVNNQRVPSRHPITDSLNLINSIWPPYRFKGLLATFRKEKETGPSWLSQRLLGAFWEHAGQLLANLFTLHAPSNSRRILCVS